jgi:hypothetical protein
VQLAQVLVALRRGRDADAQVDPFEMMPALTQAFFQLGKDARAQIIALRLHVQERAADEDRAR